MFKKVHNLKEMEILRKDLRQNITPEELILCYKLRNSRLGYKFRRQHSIGNFIVDFYCPLKKLVVELDGGQHLENKEYDKERTEFFESLGIKVLRFWNSDLSKNNINQVLLKIVEELEKLPPLHNPLLS
jgi:very-short-patch-repair endonuclease